MSNSEIPQFLFNKLKARAIGELVSIDEQCDTEAHELYDAFVSLKSYPQGTMPLASLDYMSDEDVANHMQDLYASMLWTAKLMMDTLPLKTS